MRWRALHDAALEVLERLGICVLLPEARQILAAAGARVMDDMVFIGADLVAEALRTAPRSWRMRAANPARERDYAPGQLLFARGRRLPQCDRPAARAAAWQSGELSGNADPAARL